MDNATVAGKSANGKSSRHERGIALGIERFEEIVRVGPYLWSVPSCSGNHAYTVNLKSEACPCADRTPERTPEGETDKHVVAAKYKRAKTATCSGCRTRLPHRELVDVPEGNYTFLEGELLCRPCGRDHGVL